MSEPEDDVEAIRVWVTSGVCPWCGDVTRGTDSKVKQLRRCLARAHMAIEEAEELPSEDDIPDERDVSYDVHRLYGALRELAAELEPHCELPEEHDDDPGYRWCRICGSLTPFLEIIDGGRS